ncbi:helix-turn-helix domain-containing protein [Mycobacterium sp. CBMA293]|uniref:helix-turn-helix domain-containing protein n=1 Tax=unclassified Mycolicibacterium TaxID=2636767 RepID=UPI0012DDDABF|nr:MULTISPECIES: XRE family transcriptional regulator [unclassified Mycolicibacterium]MUL45558.1 helix-turn-helix domain-containing protein [Mycolicibacterium sp. CBMA 360]MUL60228.1 helix-turn-helix domain-containing protein [Mycolicibacterium sp. CBMA 335]MUL71560.1 helix-turn-helix domain-containing protein [Mycolicibacterium sp. CBMA 311]MUL73015.1 helix-turn-helix domain-containing protein [Mycolicibacterium sp. CBMA 311]MUL96010.1 helix-turn-helix domain-containing protein [Mycolicibacte
MQANPEADDIESRVRRRLRELRTERGMTLEDVARAADIDVSTLSRLESGKRRFALDHLPRLAAALSVTTDELMRTPEADDPRVRGASHSRDGITYWPLTRGGPAGGLHTFKIRVSARRRTPPAELPVHDGQEWLYVLSGHLRLLLGDRDFTIKPGEAVEFSTWTPHWFGTVDGPVEAIAIFGPHGEKLHIRN